MDQQIVEWYEAFVRLCKALAEMDGEAFEPEPGATEEEIAACEEALDAVLPDELRDLFVLTRGIDMEAQAEFSLILPEDPFENEDGITAACVGTAYGTDYFIDLENGKAYSYDDGLQINREYDSIDDMLTYMYEALERFADDEYGDEWRKVYNEMFPDHCVDVEDDGEDEEEE